MDRDEQGRISNTRARARAPRSASPPVQGCPGSQQFKEMIIGYANAYRKASTKLAKMTITKELVESLQNTNNARFLRPVPQSWAELNLTKSRDKVSHALHWAVLGNSNKRSTSGSKSSRRSIGSFSSSIGAESGKELLESETWAILKECPILSLVAAQSLSAPITPTCDEQFNDNPATLMEGGTPTAKAAVYVSLSVDDVRSLMKAPLPDDDLEGRHVLKPQS